jgi:hypothetical protein
MAGPKEDQAEKKARTKERAMAQRERSSATEELSAGLTSDNKRTYESPFSLFNLMGRRK